MIFLYSKVQLIHVQFYFCLVPLKYLRIANVWYVIFAAEIVCRLRRALFLKFDFTGLLTNYCPSCNTP